MYFKISSNVLAFLQMAALRALHTECGSHDKGCSTSQPTLQYQKASRRAMAIYPEPHALEPRVTMFNTSAVLPGNLGCDLSDYKKRSWSVTWGSDDRRRGTGSTFIGQMYLYRVRPTVTPLLAPCPDCGACGCCKMLSRVQVLPRKQPRQ